MNFNNDVSAWVAFATSNPGVSVAVNVHGCVIRDGELVALFDDKDAALACMDAAGVPVSNR